MRPSSAPRTTDQEIKATGAAPGLLHALEGILLPWRARASTPSSALRILGSFALLALLLVGIGFVDYLTGRQYSIFVIYAVPIVWAAWNLGTATGLLFAGLGCLSWVVANKGLAEPWVWWNAVSRFAVLGVLAYVVSLHRALRQALARAVRLARSDPLTGLLNGRAFAVLAAREIDRMRRHGRPLTLAYLDLDDFKEINDSAGHGAGDRALVSVAKRLLASVRRTDVAARLGGDEFVVLFPETAEVEALHILQRFRDRLGSLADGPAGNLTVSAGLVTWRRPPAGLDAMVHTADAQMYAAKRAGKNNIRQATVDAAGADDEPAADQPVGIDDASLH